MLTSKCILEIINNFKELDCDIEENVLNNIIEENINIIRDNLKILEQFSLTMNLKEFKKKRIDKIYSDIIVSLIRSNRFDDFDYIHDIISQLDLEKIELTKDIVDELYAILNDDMNFIKQYELLNAKDIFINKKINFYYFLFKYILKNSIYIYQFPFLVDLRKKIIKLIKNNLNEELFKIKNIININDKIEYVIKTFVGSDYYYFKFINYIKLISFLNIYYITDG